jgi:hypothetical protein
MNGFSAAEMPGWQQRLLSPWAIAGILVAAFLATEAYQAWRDRGLESALEQYPAFAAPELQLEFSKTIPYDPLSFVGRGAHAGFWKWTPTGLELEQAGERFFRMEGDRIVSQGKAGARQLTRIRSHTPQGAGQQIEFFYEWTELSPVATALLVPAPKLDQEFLATAMLVPSPDGWKVESLQTRDFDEPLARLQDVAGGIRR